MRSDVSIGPYWSQLQRIGVPSGASIPSRSPRRRADGRRDAPAAGPSPPLTGDEYLESHPGRPRDLGLRRARRGRHHAPRVPQRDADGRPPVRHAARPRAPGRPHHADRHRQRRRSRTRSSAPRSSAEELRRRPRRDRRVGAHDLRLDGPLRPTTRPRSSAPSAPTPTSTSRTRTTRSAGTATRRSAACTSTTRSSTRRSTASGRRRGARRLHPRRAETDEGLIVSGAKVVATGSALTQLQLHRPLRRRADQDEGVRADLRRADGRAGREADLPPVLRATRPRSWAARSTTRCPAGWTRTTRS